MVKTFSIELIFAFDRKLSQSFESIDKGESMAIVGYARYSGPQFLDNSLR
jgi:hypothetical protein